MTEQTIEEIREEISRLEGELREAKARAKALRPAGKVRESRPCQCGCGLTTFGTWAIGHDAKKRSQLLTAIRAGGPEGEAALAELVNDFPSLLHGQSPEEVKSQLGSETRKQEAAIERKVEADRAKEAKVRPAPKPGKSAKTRVDPVEAMQGTKSPTVTRNGAAIRNAQQRAA